MVVGVYHIRTGEIPLLKVLLLPLIMVICKVWVSETLDHFVNPLA